MSGDGIGQAWTPYCGSAPAPPDLLSRWNFDPWLLLALAGATFAWHRWAKRGGRSQPASFLGAIAVLALLFVTPLCALTSALFSARAAHHALLVAVAAPLLAWSLPGHNLQRRPPVAASTAIAAAVLWAWHVPALYAAALSHALIYWAMQGSLLASAVMFWTAVRRTAVPAAVAALLASMVQMGLLGAILTFASAPLYSPHFMSTAAWGLTPLEDQQLAGLVMWVPAAAIYLLAMLLLAGRWLRAEARASA